MKITNLHSKRNSVYLVEDNDQKYVRKVFSSKKSFDNEVNALTRLQGNKVARLVKVYDLTIETEYIEGQTLIDFLSLPDCDFALAAKELSDFLKVFHQEFDGLTLSDVNFHNFIVSKEGLYALDFEKFKVGTIQQAVQRISAFALRDLPKEKAFLFINLLLEELDIQFDSIKKEVFKYKSYLSRRKNRNKAL